jgi:hypothetical protein
MRIHGSEGFRQYGMKTPASGVDFCLCPCVCGWQAQDPGGGRAGQAARTGIGPFTLIQTTLPVETCMHHSGRKKRVPPFCSETPGGYRVGKGSFMPGASALPRVCPLVVVVVL